MSRNRIIPASPARSATRNPLYSHDGSTKKSVFFYCLFCIFTASWNKPARRTSTNKWRYAQLIKSDKFTSDTCKKIVFHFEIFFNACANFLRPASREQFKIVDRAIKI